MRIAGGLVSAGVLLLCAAPAAQAEGGYEAKWVSQSPANGTKIETGERLDATLVATNVGTQAWGANVKLVPGDGATVHGDAISELADESWLGARRIALLSSQPVAPNADGRFAFKLKGPPTDAPRDIRQYVIPVAEGEAWMDSPVGQGTWQVNGVHFNLQVIPSAPPTIAIDAAPPTVVTGQTVPVTATAADNVRVAGVAARIDDQPVAALSGTPASGTVPTTGLAPGAHTLTVAAVDGAGNITTAQAPLTISADTGVANGSPAGPATLTAGLSGKRRARLTVGFGKRAEIGGRLRVTDTKTPIAGARLDLEARTSGSRRWRTVGAVSTDRLGRYQTRLPRGPSRTVRVVYRAQTKLADPTATRTVRIATRAPVRLGARLRGRALTMSGRLGVGPLPRGGLLISLQGKQRGDRWREIKTVRAKGKRRAFRGGYRFGGGGRFALRAVVKAQAGYPYARGTSNLRRVRVR